MDENNPLNLDRISLFFDINIPSQDLEYIASQINDSNMELIKLSSIISIGTSPDFSFRLQEVTDRD